MVSLLARTFSSLLFLKKLDSKLKSVPGNNIHNLADFSASEVLDNNKSVLTLFGIETCDDELDLPYIFDSKDAQNPYKHTIIVGSSKCSTKPPFILLTQLLTHIQQPTQEVGSIR